MLDYDEEAERYDASRGGEPRAAAAAEAVLGLIPAGARDLLDTACGTGIVTRRFSAARDGLRVTGVDLAPAMARRAAARLPGAVVRADGRRLPFGDARFDAVVSVWLLHLASGPKDVRALIGECARVLRPGGVYVTTVDKGASHNVGSSGASAARAGGPPVSRPAASASTAARTRVLRTVRSFLGVGGGREWWVGEAGRAGGEGSVRGPGGSPVREGTRPVAGAPASGAGAGTRSAGGGYSRSSAYEPMARAMSAWAQNRWYVKVGAAPPAR